MSDFIGINEHREVTVRNHAEGKDDYEEGRELASPKWGNSNKAKTIQHTLDWADRLWTKYKGKHFADTMISLADDMDKFSKENVDVAKLW